jgi:hypothetical protein
METSSKVPVFFLLLQNRRTAGQDRPCDGIRVGTSGKGREGKDVGVQIYCKHCIHIYVNGKMTATEIISGKGGR